MALQHVRLDMQRPEARFAGDTVPRLHLRQALFRTPNPGWQARLYRAALVVTTIAHGPDARKLAVDHQVLRFSLLYNETWPEPVFRDITKWHYKPLELREDAPVVNWTVEFRLRELRLLKDERVELIFLG